MAIPRLPLTAAPVVIAISGRFVVIARMSRPPSASPKPNRRSSASVVSLSQIPASQTAAALPTKRAPATSIDVPANTPLGYLLVERWVALDVGETLIDETRIWSIWADVLGIPRLTFMAGLGATLATGGDFRDVFSRFGADDWRGRLAEVEATYGGFQESDLYPDARRSVEALCQDGYRVALLANQPARRTPELRALGFAPDVMAMSEEMGVAKPDPAFFARALDLMGEPQPGQVAYVGDRLDNDVMPAARAGMRAVWLRRGPWGLIGDPSNADAPAAARLVVDSLDELVRRIGEVWD